MRTIKSMSEMGKLAEMETAHKMFLDAVKNRTTDISRDVIVDGYFYDYDVLDESKFGGH